MCLKMVVNFNWYLRLITSMTRKLIEFLLSPGVVMSSWTSCYKSGTLIHWKGERSRKICAVFLLNARILLHPFLMLSWHLNLLTFELAECVADDANKMDESRKWHHH